MDKQTDDCGSNGDCRDGEAHVRKSLTLRDGLIFCRSHKWPKGLWIGWANRAVDTVGVALKVHLTLKDHVTTRAPDRVPRLDVLQVFSSEVLGHPTVV